MKVREMSDDLKYPIRIAFKNADDNLICIAESNSEGTEPYLEREIVEWYLPNPFMENPRFADTEIYMMLKDK